jgi:tetratricopeptide (TPR) repeat protein
LGQGDLQLLIERAAAHLAGNPRLAERQAREILYHAPSDPRVALIYASALRRCGKFRQAREILEPLARAHPEAPLTQYELGVVQAACGEDAAAICSLRRAVELNPLLPEAWRALGERLFLDGDAPGAEEAYRRQAHASIRDPGLRQAADALFEDRLADAQTRLRAHLGRHPDDGPALRMLADVSTRHGRPADAEALLLRALQLDPDFDGARFSYARLLFEQQRPAEAVPHVERLLAREGRDPAYRNLLAGCLALLGDDQRVLEIYSGLVADYGRQPKLWLNYGHALKTAGRRRDAVDAYRRALALAPGLAEAYWSLANMKVGELQARDEAAMRALIGQPSLAAADSLHLRYALGRVLEERGNYEDSFRHYAAGAAVARRQLRYAAGELSARVRRSQGLFTRQFFETRGGGAAGEAPVFIVGLPRSGSTLLEQILASHPAVEGTMELPYIGLIARKLEARAGRSGGAGYPEVLAQLDAAEREALGASYLESARRHCRLGRPRLIDKMPNNFQHLGLIRLILPGARIIDARRHPLAACLSAFKQHFAQGQPFSYDLEDLGRYYRDYLELMAHFETALPGWIHRVIYEDLVEDCEGEVRRLLDFCGLPFAAACLAFHENDRPVRTVSCEQVRQPLFREGLDRWRCYEPWLDPLKRALGPALERWRE